MSDQNPNQPLPGFIPVRSNEQGAPTMMPLATLLAAAAATPRPPWWRVFSRMRWNRVQKMIRLNAENDEKQMQAILVQHAQMTNLVMAKMVERFNEFEKRMVLIEMKMQSIIATAQGNMASLKVVDDKN